MHKLKKYLQKFPRPLVKFLRNVFLSTLDMKERFEGKSDALLPPRSLHFIGGGDFKAIGENYVGHFINVCNLKPTEIVLDIGCGTGRMAIPLIKFLDSAGRYIGFDISKKAIIWCQKNITEQNSNFIFHFANIHNTEYNPKGKVSAAEYRFPCGNNEVDFAFATSVFTHLRRDVVTHYLAELRRTLKPSGQAMLSFFILDEENGHLVRNDHAMFNFTHDLGDCYTIDPKTPERAIAYSIEDVNSMIANAGLHLKSPILFGSWSGRRSMLNTQDVVIVTKTKQ